MSTKTISIRDYTYDLLKNVKKDGESFSDVINRLLKKEKRDLSVYFGALDNEAFLEGLEEDSRKIREFSRLRTEKLSYKISDPCNVIHFT